MDSVWRALDQQDASPKSGCISELISAELKSLVVHLPEIHPKPGLSSPEVPQPFGKRLPLGIRLQFQKSLALFFCNQGVHLLINPDLPVVGEFLHLFGLHWRG
ncbi:MAG: hypothetical protein DRJ61_05445 [Acidobacteria bacterium]|nr:MAG: hypothetical protein DRJ65_01240 [Acidobacteriota bacterium]RLE34305.1 MAG: hypothetical protein DRJ61_05445 [Acidobacteriota bacterium]